MRDSNRIPVILEQIEFLWRKYPDMRLMQLLLSAVGPHKDHFNTEDDKVLEGLKRIKQNAS